MGELSWKLHDAQRLIYHALKALPPSIKTAVVLCCRRFGKSYLGTILANEACLKSPSKIIRVIGPDVKQTMMIVNEAMTKITSDLSKIGRQDLVQWVKSDKMYRIGQSQLFLGGFDSQEDSLRGGEADLIIVEETGSSNPEQYHYQMREVLKPQLLKTRGRMIHMTTLPKENDHPFITETIPEARLDGAFYSFTIYDDPLATQEIIADAIKDCGGISSIAFQREYLNVIVRDPTIVVVPTFDRMRHVAPNVDPTDSHWQIAMDMGGTVDKTVAQLMTYEYLTDLDWVVDERVFDANTPTSAIVAELKAMEASYPRWPISQRVADCPGQTQIDLNSDHGYAVVAPQKSDWQASVNQMVARFAQDKVRVHPRCKFTIQSLESGRLRRDRKDFERTAVLGHCDALASLMYGLRCLDRTSPYPVVKGPRYDQFTPPKPSEHEDLANAVAPKSFGSVGKRFGTFR